MPLFLLLLFICLPNAHGDSNSTPVETRSSILDNAKQAASDHQWGMAEKLYKKAKKNSIQQGDADRTLDILFSLLTVYQQQSDGVSAFKVATEIEQLVVNLSDPFSLSRSYRLLGIAYQSLANNELARDYYSVAVESARELNNPTLLASLLNELGYADVLVTDYRSAKMSFEESYRLARSMNLQDLMLQAQINLLRVIIALGEKEKIKQKFNLLESLITEIPVSEKIVENYISLGTLYRTAQIKLELNHSYRKTAYLWHERSLKLAKKYKNNQLQSISNGYIGQIYADEKQYTIAGRFTQEAIVLAQKINNLDLVYRWSVQLSRIFSAQNKIGSALKQYKSAINILDSLDIVNFMRYERSFNIDVKPVFDELFVLLFQNVRKIKDESSIQAELQRIVHYAEKLRFKELAAFCFGNCKIKQEEIVGTLSDSEVVLYTLVSEKHLYVILKGRAGIYFKIHKVSRKNLLLNLKKLTKNIRQSKSEKSYIIQAKKFHRWLIAPFDDVLKNNNVQTISFVPAQELMKLPFGVLYEKNHYLIENYALKYVLSGIKSVKAEKWKHNGQNYHLLPTNEFELPIFSENKNNTKITSNEEIQTLKEKVSDIKHDQLFNIFNRFKLANDYRQSIIVMQDENLPLFGIVNKINSGKKLGLLLFSNNEPNKMNNIYFNSQMINSTSVVAPLWSYSQEASQRLISQFYQFLQAGFNVENALQRAKIALISHKTFNHPKNWASLLVLQHN